LFYAVTTHLKLPEISFWTSSHRKIVELLEIDKEVNTVKPKNGKKTTQSKGQKMSLKEAMKIL